MTSAQKKRRCSCTFKQIKLLLLCLKEATALRSGWTPGVCFLPLRVLPIATPRAVQRVRIDTMAGLRLGAATISEVERSIRSLRGRVSGSARSGARWLLTLAILLQSPCGGCSRSGVLVSGAEPVEGAVGSASVPWSRSRRWLYLGGGLRLSAQVAGRLG